MKNYIKESIILALSVVILGVLLHSAFITFCEKDRLVQVRGLAEMEVPANRVIWHLSYNELGNDLSQVYASIKDKNTVIYKFLKDHGILGEEVSVSAPDVMDMEAQKYSENHSAFRYNVQSTMTVASDKVDLVRKAISGQAELINKGIALSTSNSGPEFGYEGAVVYSYTKLNDIKPKMIEDATRNARAAAEKFAKDSESKLGKIRWATQGQFSIEDRDMSTPYIKQVRVVTSVAYSLED